MSTEPKVTDRTLAEAALAAGNPTGWFEPLYAAAESGDAVLPWDRGVPNAELVTWLDGRDGTGLRALVVGCALGDDAEAVAAAGYATTAFDISPTAIKTVRTRFPESTVDYVVADLLDPPAAWHRAFDLVVEIINIQSMPRDVRPAALGSVSGFIAAGGTALVSAVAEESSGTSAGPPWPLSRAEVESIARDGVRLESIEKIRDDSRWLAIFTR